MKFEDITRTALENELQQASYSYMEMFVTCIMIMSQCTSISTAYTMSKCQPCFYL